jgi:hypothetical protein
MQEIYRPVLKSIYKGNKSGTMIESTQIRKQIKRK